MRQSTKRKLERQDRRSHCTKKIDYKTPEDAEKELQRFKTELAVLGNEKAAKRMQVYKCTYCDRWHIGKEPYEE